MNPLIQDQDKRFASIKDSTLQDKGFESHSEEVKTLETKSRDPNPWHKGFDSLSVNFKQKREGKKIRISLLKIWISHLEKPRTHEGSESLKKWFGSFYVKITIGLRQGIMIWIPHSNNPNLFWVKLSNTAWDLNPQASDSNP